MDVVRPKYRSTKRKDIAVKVYTINQESRYLRVSNVSSRASATELIRVFATFGTIEEWRQLVGHSDSTEYTDVYWIRFSSFPEARMAKKRLNDFTFLTLPLEVSYAPEYESINDTRAKLEDRKQALMKALLGNTQKKRPSSSLSYSSPPMQPQTIPSSFQQTPSQQGGLLPLPTTQSVQTYPSQSYSHEERLQAWQQYYASLASTSYHDTPTPDPSMYSSLSTSSHSYDPNYYDHSSAQQHYQQAEEPTSPSTITLSTTESTETTLPTMAYDSSSAEKLKEPPKRRCI